MAVTALTTRGITAASKTLKTAATLVSALGGAVGNNQSLLGKALGFGEVTGLGTNTAWAALTSIDDPTGSGFLFDTSVLEGQQIVAGKWTPTLRMYITDVGSLTADIWVRAFKRSSAGVYTPIGVFTLTGQTFTHTTAVYSPAAQSLNPVTFDNGDKIYTDCWLNILTNGFKDAGLNVAIGLSSTGDSLANDMQMVTPGYQAAPAAVFSISPTTLSFTATLGGSNPASQAIALSNTGGQNGTWALVLTGGGSWLSAGSLSGSLPSMSSANVSLSVNIAGLTAGTYTNTATFTFTPTTGSVITSACTVTLTVTSTAVVQVSVTPSTLSYSGVYSGGNPPDKNITVTNTGTVDGSWASAITGSPSGWLITSPISGDLAAGVSTTVALSVFTTGLAVGTYTNTATFTLTPTSGAPVSAAVVVTLTITAVPKGDIAADLHFRVFRYNTFTGLYALLNDFLLTGQVISPTPQVFSFPLATLSSTVFSPGDRLYVDLWPKITNNATSNSSLKLLATVSSLGTPNDMQLDTPGYTLVSGVVLSSPQPQSLFFSATLGAKDPPVQTVSLTNSTSTPAVVDITSDSDWLEVSPSSGVVPANGTLVLTTSVLSSTLTVGTYNGALTYTTSGGSGTIGVTTAVLAAATPPCGGPSNHWQLLLACQDISNYIDPTTIHINDTLGSSSTSGTSGRAMATRAGTLQVNTSLGPMTTAIGKGSTLTPGTRPKLVRMGEIIVYDATGSTVFGGYATKYTDITTTIVGQTLQPFTTLNAIDYLASLDRVLINEAFVGQTDLQIITKVITKYAPWVDLSLLPTVAAYVFPLKTFTNISVLGVLQTVSSTTGFFLWVDFQNRLHYVNPEGTNTAPFSLSSAPNYTTSFPHNVQEYIIEDTAAINRVFFSGGRKISNDFTQDLSPFVNGTISVFSLAYPSIHPTALGGYAASVNNVPQVVGTSTAGGPASTLKSQGGLCDALIDEANSTITFDKAPPKLAVVTVTYRFDFPLLVVVTDEASHNFFGDPYLDGHISDTGVLDTATAIQRCRVLLSQQSFGLTTLKVDTWYPGLQAGQTIHVFNKVRGINDTYLIQEVEIEWLAAGTFIYHVTLGAWNWNLVDLVMKLATEATAPAGEGETQTVEQALPIFTTIKVASSWTYTAAKYLPPFYSRLTPVGDGHDAYPGYATPG